MSSDKDFIELVEYKWKLPEDYTTTISDKTIIFGNKWVNIQNGTMRISKGYAWDGCTPKWRIKKLMFGIPDGKIDPETGKQMCYYASLVHDVLYQFVIGDRKDADEEFLKRMKGFIHRRQYYYAVRHWGWIGWNKNKRKILDGR